MGQAVLARRENHSKRLCVGNTFGFGLLRVFHAEVLNFLRRQAHQALLIRTPRAALRACPPAAASLCRIDFRKIHRRPIVGTSDSGNRVHLVRVSVLGQDEVSTKDVVVNETIRLQQGIHPEDRDRVKQYREQTFREKREYVDE